MQVRGRALLLAAVLFVGSVCAQQTGTFIDSRDGQTYRTVKIGNQTWMAQNMNYRPQPGRSGCYDKDIANCNKYGRLYDWNTAKTVCPKGWKLPDTTDWNKLAQTVGGKQRQDCNGGACYVVWNNAGNKLKSKSGWNENGNGTDDFGYSALPGGYRDNGGEFGSAGDVGHWWTATENDSDYAYVWSMGYNNSDNAEYRLMHCFDDFVAKFSGDKSYGISVRCVQE